MRPTLQVGERRLVRRDEPGPCAALDAHVADRHPLLHRQGPDRLAPVLEDVAGPAGDPDPGNEREDDVLGPDARREGPVHPDFVRLRFPLEQRLRRQDHLDLGRPDPERQRPEGAMRAGMGVAAHDGHARLGQAQLRPDDMDDALARIADAVEGDPELATVRVQLLHLGGRLLVEEWETAGGRGHGMISGGDGPFGMPNGQPALAQPGECLRARDFVDEVEVNREDGRRAGIIGDDVVIPDLLDERSMAFGFGYGHGCCSGG